MLLTKCLTGLLKTPLSDYGFKRRHESFIKVTSFGVIYTISPFRARPLFSYNIGVSTVWTEPINNKLSNLFEGRLRLEDCYRLYASDGVVFEGDKQKLAGGFLSHKWNIEKNEMEEIQFSDDEIEQIYRLILSSADVVFSKVSSLRTYLQFCQMFYTPSFVRYPALIMRDANYIKECIITQENMIRRNDALIEKLTREYESILANDTAQIDIELENRKENMRQLLSPFKYQLDDISPYASADWKS